MKMTFEGMTIELTRRANCRCLILRHRVGEGFFRMSAPMGASGRDIAAFLGAHLDWMHKQLAAAPAPAFQPVYARAGSGIMCWASW